MATPTEDIPYAVSNFAIPEPEDRTPDPDQVKKSVLVKVADSLADDIAFYSNFESLELPNNATREEKIAAYDTIAIYKGLSLHLKKYKTMIDNKLKEIK